MKSYIEQERIKVHCPRCANSRLFDLSGRCSGILHIKCPKCKKEVEIQLEHCNEQQYKRQITYYRIHENK